MTSHKLYRYKSMIICLLLAFFIKNVIPVGFMPDKTNGQEMGFIICSSHDTLISSGLPLQDEEEETKDCPFSFCSSQKTIFSDSLSTIEPVARLSVFYTDWQRHNDVINYNHFSSRAPPASVIT